MALTAEEYADFRILARCPSGSKKNSSAYDTTNGIIRYRFTLGEVLSWNIDIDVIVGNGWTRITLKEIPRFIVDAFDFIMSNGLQLDGIFRREGNSARLNRQEIQEVYRGLRPIPDDFTVLDVCTMVKRFLKDLKPMLLNSENVRNRLIERAKNARITGDFTLSHEEMCRLFENPTRHLSPSHLGTLAYVMRFLSRIAKHSDTHKMTTDNLAVVLVGSVFGDFMAGGGTESRKKMQQVRKCTEAELIAKKEDMGVQVAAVKLLIVNANLIALPKSHYVSSNRLHSSAAFPNIRSTSAMPNIRCASVSEAQTGMVERFQHAWGTPPSVGPSQVFNMAKASLLQQRSIIRRDSDLTHVKHKPRDSGGGANKRSSSFLPIASLRGLRDKVSNQFLKRNKSPSPEKLRRQAVEPSPSPSVRVASGVDTFRGDVSQSPRKSGEVQNKKGSTSSGRKSRAHTKKGNINAVLQLSPPPGSGGSSRNSTITSSRSLRRFSQSEQNSFRKSNGDSTPPLEKKKKKEGLVRRNTSDGMHNPRNEGIKRRSTFWGVDTIAEDEKENHLHQNENQHHHQRKREDTGDEDDEESALETGDAGESVMELMNYQARMRRVGAGGRRRRMENGTSDSMMGLNGSTMDRPTKIKDSVKTRKEIDILLASEPETPVFPTVFTSTSEKKPKSAIGMQLERELKQRLDVMATPMMSRRTASESVAKRPSPVMISPHKTPLSAIPLRKLDSIGDPQNGRAWVGKTQTFVSSPIPKTDVEKVKQSEKVSPILARSPIFRSPSVHTPMEFPKSSFAPSPSHYIFRSKSHLTEERIFGSHNYNALAIATPPRDRRLQRSPQRTLSNLIYHTPKTRRCAGESPLSSSSGSSTPRAILRSASSVGGGSRTPSGHPNVPSPLIQHQRNSVDDSVFKCPLLLPPMKSHEVKSTKRCSQQPRKSRESSVDDSHLGFGEFNEILKTSTEDTKFPILHQAVEARPSVTMLRSSQCGLVQSRINQFQGLERSQRLSTDLSSSGRHSAISQTSLKSIDTISTSSGGRMMQH